VARDRKSSQRRRGNPQPARPRPKPAAGKPTPGTPGRSGDAAKPPVGDDAPLGKARPIGDAPVGDAPVDEAQPVGSPLGDAPIHVASPADSAVADESLLGDATVDEVFEDDESVIAALEPADLPVGAVPTDPPLLPPIESIDGETAATSEFASTRERLAANRLDESDEILPAARRAGRPPAKVGGNKVTSFLRASWAELQRVQWPDRRQVGQATAVVLGFVAIAGGFLGLANLLGSDLVNALL
jgi:preprotein translocase SecE subunit